MLDDTLISLCSQLPLVLVRVPEDLFHISGDSHLTRRNVLSLRSASFWGN